MTRAPLRGTPVPLGAHWDGHGTNFALFSAHAEQVELCLFDADGDNEVERIALRASGETWHAYLSGRGPGTVYGYRVHGPWQPAKGHRFNPNKLLLDPYARRIRGRLEWDDAVYAFDRSDAGADPPPDTRDSAAYVPKSVVVDEIFDWGGDRPPRTPWAQTVIYELHAGGFTRLHPHIDARQRGRFAALASDSVIAYLHSLGVTAVELLPVHAFIDDHFLVNKGLGNYWGYNSIGYFAPAARYLSDGDRNEFKAMVKRLHQAGIEVILDVVYNHTAEGDHSGPSLSFRGIDNAVYYRLEAADKRRYVNDSGCGNTLNLNHPQVLQLVLDSLRHWVEEMHVDGFRFDLAVSLGREASGFNGNGAFFSAIRQDPVLSRVKLIAEPWDIGPGGYQLGAFPPGWSEWNDRFRDCLRRYWRGDRGMLPQLARSLHGSSDLFEHNGRRPSASINFVTSHDGFTLADLVSYAERHNQANGEGNRDGHSANFSCNHGVEGPTDDARIRAARRRHQRNLLATLLFAQGTPMLLAGDELGRSQHGNNNAYCQDNAITWQDWSALEHESGLLAYVRALIRLRQRYPLLHRDRFVHGVAQYEPSGFTDIQWLRADGRTMREADWHDPEQRFLAMLLAAETMPARNPLLDGDQDAALVIAFNAGSNDVELRLPPSRNHWQCVFSSAEAMPAVAPPAPVAIEAHSVQLFELQI